MNANPLCSNFIYFPYKRIKESLRNDLCIRKLRNKDMVP